MAGAVGPGEEWEAAGLPCERRESCVPRGARQTHGQLPAVPHRHEAQHPARLPPRWQCLVGSPCHPWSRAGLCSLLRGGRAEGDPVCGAHSLPCVQSRAGQGAAGGLSCCPRPRAGSGGLSSRGSAVPQAEEEKRRKKEEAARKRQEQEVASASAGGLPAGRHFDPHSAVRVSRGPAAPTSVPMFTWCPRDAATAGRCLPP